MDCNPDIPRYIEPMQRSIDIKIERGFGGEKMSLRDGVVRTHTDAQACTHDVGPTHPRTVVKMAPRTDGVSQATVNKNININLEATVVREPPTTVGLWRAKLHVGTSVTRGV